MKRETRETQRVFLSFPEYGGAFLALFFNICLPVLNWLTVSSEYNCTTWNVFNPLNSLWG